MSIFFFAVILDRLQFTWLFLLCFQGFFAGLLFAVIVVPPTNQSGPFPQPKGRAENDGFANE
jgi:hypothetical protein